MKTITLLAILAAASLAQAGEPYAYRYDWREVQQQRAAQRHLEQIEWELRLARQQQREADLERHFQAERDFTFRSMFGK